MDAILAIVTGTVGWLFAGWMVVDARRNEREIRAAHAKELERRDDLERQLIDQVQLNAQGMPFYPQIGPFPDAEPERTYVASPDGLLVVPEDELADALAEIDRTV